MSNMSRACAVALLAASLGGCNGGIGQAFGGGGGVMPETEVGPPPSMRGAVPGAQARRSSNVDDDGNPAATTPTRQLALPKNVKGGTQTADAAPRRIDREDLEGADTQRRGGSSMAPMMTPSGGVGMGGKF